MTPIYSPEVRNFECALLWAGLCSSGDGQLNRSKHSLVASSIAVQTTKDSGLHQRTMGEAENSDSGCVAVAVEGNSCRVLVKRVIIEDQQQPKLLLFKYLSVLNYALSTYMEGGVYVQITGIACFHFSLLFVRRYIKVFPEPSILRSRGTLFKCEREAWQQRS